MDKCIRAYYVPSHYVLLTVVTKNSFAQIPFPLEIVSKRKDDTQRVSHAKIKIKQKCTAKVRAINGNGRKNGKNTFGIFVCSS